MKGKKVTKQRGLTTHKILACIAVLLPVILIFRAFFTNSSLSLGDAPYFGEGVSNWFLGEPSAWTQRGISFGGVNQFLWISPLMFFLSVAQTLLHLDHGAVIRLFFYFPSVILATTGAYAFARSIKQSLRTAFFVALISVLNTYYILLVDGGQVGIALAYGIFPWTLKYLIQYAQEKHINRHFVLGLISLSVLTVADPRFALIGIFTAALLLGKRSIRLLPLLFVWLALNLYWLYPLVTILPVVQQNSSEGLQLTSLISGIFLYAPHWYQNIFGNVSYPSLLFLAIPTFVILSSVKPKGQTTKYLLMWLLFVFLVKGTTDPLGIVYKTLVSLPFGSAFRDSTKFFVPLILVTGVLIGRGVEYLGGLINKKVVTTLAYCILVLSLSPALLGKLNFVLSTREALPEIESINSYIQGATNDRTVWLTERNPRSLETPQHQVIDGKSLVELRPFASLNAGSSDLFNFFNRPEAEGWLTLFGIKNVVLSGNPRIVSRTEEEQKDWERINSLLPTLSYLRSVDIGTKSPVYSTREALPTMFGVNKLFVVLGGDDIYQKLSAKFPEFKPYQAGFVFVDDGKWDPSSLGSYATSSAVILNNNSSGTDLTLSQLQSFFVSPSKAQSAQWARFNSSEYLKYKYELLIRDIQYHDFDYSRGIAFSSVENEKMSYVLDAPKDGEYVLAIRSMGKPDSRGISVRFAQVANVTTATPSFEWSIYEVPLQKGKSELVLENISGLSVVNVVALIPKDLFAKTEARTNDLLSSYSFSDVQSLPMDAFSSTWSEVPVIKTGPARYTISPTENVRWIVWTNNYHPDWKITRDTLSYNSIPFYSSVNGIYKRPEWSEMILEFEGQKSVRWGIYYSVLSLLIVSIYLIWQTIKK